MQKNPFKGKRRLEKNLDLLSSVSSFQHVDMRIHIINSRTVFVFSEEYIEISTDVMQPIVAVINTRGPKLLYNNMDIGDCSFYGAGPNKTAVETRHNLKKL